MLAVQQFPPKESLKHHTFPVFVPNAIAMQPNSGPPARAAKLRRKQFIMLASMFLVLAAAYVATKQRAANRDDENVLALLNRVRASVGRGPNLPRLHSRDKFYRSFQANTPYHRSDGGLGLHPERQLAPTFGSQTGGIL